VRWPFGVICIVPLPCIVPQPHRPPPFPSFYSTSSTSSIPSCRHPFIADAKPRSRRLTSDSIQFAVSPRLEVFTYAQCVSWYLALCAVGLIRRKNAIKSTANRGVRRKSLKYQFKFDPNRHWEKGKHWNAVKK